MPLDCSHIYFGEGVGFFMRRGNSDLCKIPDDKRQGLKLTVDLVLDPDTLLVLNRLELQRILGKMERFDADYSFTDCKVLRRNLTMAISTVRQRIPLVKE
jgi:hypothetical protein